MQCPECVLCRSWSDAGIPEYFPAPSAGMAAGVSRSDFSEVAAGSSKLLGIITSGTGTCESQTGSWQRYPRNHRLHHICPWLVAYPSYIFPTKAGTFCDSYRPMLSLQISDQCHCDAVFFFSFFKKYGL